ncbi:MAG: methyltransferase domain-containing protein [Terrimonas sp.]|nr:methyltransferase domain-containing protein [Terrimonas sp.]
MYSDFYPSVLHPFYFIRRSLFAEIRKHASRLKGNMLDFGCGSKPYEGLFTVEQYTGIDFYNEGHPHDNERIDVFYDGKHIPFPDNHFDSVLCTEVFEHVFNLEQVIQELYRVMKNDSMLLITCPFVWNEHEVPYDYARYTRFALKDLMEKQGFEILEYSKSGNFVTTLFQLWNLYWYTVLYNKVKNNVFLRWIYKLGFILPVNLGGKLLNALLPANNSLYLNNVLLVKKPGV